MSIRLAVFFTWDISVQLWNDTGLLSREKRLYEELVKKNICKEIYWFSYGVQDAVYQHLLPSAIHIISKPRCFPGKIGTVLYAFFLPIIHKTILSQCDLYKTNQMSGSFVGVLARFLCGKPLIVRTGYSLSSFARLKGYHIRYWWARFLEYFSYSYADGVIVAGEEEYKNVLRKYSISFVRRIPNYVDVEIFTSSTKQEEKVGDLVFVGRLDPQKNIENLLYALVGLPYRLDIYGSGTLKDKLKDLAKSLGVSVHFQGAVSNLLLPSILNQYTLYVLCSHYEGTPKSLLEAMACGLPCLGTNVAGIRDVLAHGKTGWLVEPTVKDLQDGISKIMGDKQLQERLGREARHFVAEQHSLAATVEKEACL